MEHGLSHGLWRQHEPLISTQLSAATWTSDAIVALFSRTGHGHQRAPWWQHGSWTSTRLQAGAQTSAICMDFGGNMGISTAPVGAQTTDTNMALDCSIDHRHSHGLWQQNRKWTSACSLAAAGPMNINMVSRGSTDRAQPHTWYVFKGFSGSTSWQSFLC